MTNLEGRRVVVTGASSCIGDLAAGYVLLTTATYITGAVLPVEGGLSLHG